MSAADLVQARWGYALPNDYCIARDRHLLDAEEFGSLRHSILRWLEPEEIARFDWPAIKVDTFIPFAVESSTACLCWSTMHGPGWVFFSPVDSEMAEGYAESFSAATFRAFIEELRGTAIGEHYDLTTEQVIGHLRQCVRRCEALWRPQWQTVADEVLARAPEVSRWETLSFVSVQEARHIIAENLAFPMFEQQIRQYID